MQSWCPDRRHMGSDAVHGHRVRTLCIIAIRFHAPQLTDCCGYLFCPSSSSINELTPRVYVRGTDSGYIASCKSIVTCARTIARAIRQEIPELYVLGDPPASVVAFGSKNSKVVSVLTVGDKMSERGWHLNGLNNPAAVHIACTVSAHPWNYFLPSFVLGELQEDLFRTLASCEYCSPKSFKHRSYFNKLYHPSFWGSSIVPHLRMYLSSRRRILLRLSSSNWMC